jgi:hypothetical protein
MSALERKRQRMNHGSARVPSWLLSTRSPKTKSILQGKSSSFSTEQCDSFETSSQKTLPTVMDSLMGNSSSSTLSTSQEEPSENDTVKEIPDAVFLPLPSAGVSKMYRHKMMMMETTGAGAEGDRFGLPTSSSMVPQNDADMNDEVDDDDRVMMMQQSERLALEYRERLNQAQHQMDSLYVKLHKSKQLQQAMKSRNMQLIHKLALLSRHQDKLEEDVEEDEDNKECRLLTEVEKSDDSISSSIVVARADAKSYLAMFLKCCMVLCLILVLSGEQVFYLAVVVFCWWLLETVQ